MEISLAIARSVVSGISYQPCKGNCYCSFLFSTFSKPPEYFLYIPQGTNKPSYLSENTNSINLSASPRKTSFHIHYLSPISSPQLIPKNFTPKTRSLSRDTKSTASTTPHPKSTSSQSPSQKFSPLHYFIIHHPPSPNPSIHPTPLIHFPSRHLPRHSEPYQAHCIVRTLALISTLDILMWILLLLLLFHRIAILKWDE